MSDMVMNDKYNYADEVWREYNELALLTQSGYVLAYIEFLLPIWLTTQLCSVCELKNIAANRYLLLPGFYYSYFIHYVACDKSHACNIVNRV